MKSYERWLVALFALLVVTFAALVAVRWYEATHPPSTEPVIIRVTPR